MPENTQFIEDTNARENAPAWLFRINISDTPDVPGDGDLYIAGNSVDIDYFETNDGVNTARTYIAWGLGHDGIPSNMEGVIDTMRISVDNVALEVSALVENRELRGRKATIRRVDRNSLGDPEAYREWYMYVDQIAVDKSKVDFVLKSKLDIQNALVPIRTFARDHCQAVYKKDGCWLAHTDGVTFTKPPNFQTDHFLVWEGEAVGDAAASVVAFAAVRFHDLDMGGMNTATDELLIDIRVSDRTKIVGQQMGIEVTSSGGPDAEELQRLIADAGTLIADNAWHTYVLPLSAFTSGIGTLNKFHVNFIRVWSLISSGPVTISIRNVKLNIKFPNTWSQNPDSCNYTRADCERHNNIHRFNATPGVPDRQRFGGA